VIYLDNAQKTMLFESYNMLETLNISGKDNIIKLANVLVRVEAICNNILEQERKEQETIEIKKEE